MAAVERLMGVGMTAEVAKRCGFFIGTVNTGATLQGPGNVYARVSGATCTLGSGFDLGDIVNIAAVVTVSLNPPAGQNFGNASVSAIHTIEAGQARSFMKFSATTWWALSST